MSELDDIRREMAGKPPLDESDSSRRPRRKPGPHQRRPEFQRKRQPTAPEGASLLAQKWYDQATAHGFALPYDVNFMALGLAARIDRDPLLQKLIEDDRQDQADRWVAKMIERWWAEYVTNEITERNAKDYFLDTDWVDLRDYARDCLRAAFLKQHGHKVEAPEYPDQTEFQQKLDQVRSSAQVDRLVKTLEDTPEREELDESRRSRLLSWRRSRERKNP